MPIVDPGRYPYQVTYVPENPQQAFPGLDMPREAVAVTRSGYATPEEFARRFPGQNFIDCISVGFNNAEGEFILLTADHLDPETSAILERLQKHLQPESAAPAQSLPQLRNWRDLDPAVAATLLDLYSEYYYALQYDTAEDDPEIEDAVSLARQLGVTAADLEIPAGA